jgi:quinol-cytochrome oxidoreductase complex cytochrome b subunit
MFPNPGVLGVALVGFGLLVGLSTFDWLFTKSYRQPVGRWIQAWARRFPVFAFLLAAVLGMLFGHFYWSTPPLCPTVSASAPPAGTDQDCTPAHSAPSAQP